MNLGKAALLAVVPFALAPLAHAQGAVYGMVTAQNLDGLTYTTVGRGTANIPVTRTNGSFAPIGGVGGVYYDFKQIGRVRLGADARASIATSSHGADPTATNGGGRIYLFMGGVRASYNPARYRLLAPYAQGSVGYARTDSGSNNFLTAPGNAGSISDGRIRTSGGVAYQGLVGLDIKTIPIMDVRLFEFGIGAISGLQNQPGSHTLESVSVGLVFHLPY